MKAVERIIPTRKSLLSRLRKGQDNESWKAFFDTYWKLIYTTSLRAGLNDAEAQDVVQETVLSVFKSMPNFHYDPEKGLFRAWLLKLTRWRITDQLRKRQRFIQATDSDTRTTGMGASGIDQIADPASATLEAVWSEEWEQTLMDAAIDRVKKKVDPEHFQVFDLYVVKKWPVLKVARTLKINPGKVYLIKHRIGNAIKIEIKKLEFSPI
ncbi:MAG TPA: sigma-70 family RNA polymerase sigma factor [Verrucomicrobiae bacterium]|jgi:RNA polymerase sigma-70 factor (ECF subfamily)|nr:sigma-70 family RNA polymerase sigma factor [Verrucomicrobiae bacterium]